MGFMWIFCQDLLDCHFSLGGSVHAQPNQAESSSSEQAYPFEIIRKAFSEFGELISGEIGFHIEPYLFSILLIELDGFFLMVLVLAGGCAFLYAFGVILLLPIK
jgi:hypothetical protein